MSLGIFSPYGRASGETGFLMVLARYLSRRGYGMVQLRCNGVLPTCGRDQLKAGGRQLMSCVECMNEQDQGTRWAELNTMDISGYFRPTDFLEHQRALSLCSIKELERFTADGVCVGEICASMMRSTTGGQEAASSDAMPDRGQRNILLQTARALNAFSRLTLEHAFDAFLTPAGDDFYLKSLAAVAERRGVRHFRFKWEAASLTMKITGALSGQEFKSNLFFDDVSAMRSNVESWPEEIQSQLKAVEMYLGITQQQLSLPII